MRLISAEALSTIPFRTPQGLAKGDEFQPCLMTKSERICQEQVGSSTERLQAEGAAQRLVEALRRVQVYKDSLRSSCTLKCL